MENGEFDDASEQSRRLVYLSAERTLSSWIRTALSLMALGFVIDRFSLILHSVLSTQDSRLYPREVSIWAGTLLVAMAVLMTLVAAARFLRFAHAYHNDKSTRVRHGIYVGAAFALLLALFGIALVAFLVSVAE